MFGISRGEIHHEAGADDLATIIGIYVVRSDMVACRFCEGFFDDFVARDADGANLGESIGRKMHLSLIHI